MVDSVGSFNPDWASPPGDTIADLGRERRWTPRKLAEHLDLDPEIVNRVIKGEIAVTEDIALRLAGLFGGRAGFWLAREAQYKERRFPCSRHRSRSGSPLTWPTS